MVKKRPINLKYCVLDHEGNLGQSYPIVSRQVRDFILPETGFGRVIRANYKDYIGFTHDFNERFDWYKSTWNRHQRDPDKIINSILYPEKDRVKRPDLMYILYQTNSHEAAYSMEQKLIDTFEDYLENDPRAKHTPPKKTDAPYYVYLLVNRFVI